MAKQYLTVYGTYMDGRVTSDSEKLPQGSFRVLITFLEPLADARGEEKKLKASIYLSKKELDQRIQNLFGINGRELKIVRLLQNGYTNVQIADEMELSTGTIRNYISGLLTKMKAANRTQLVKIAREKGILTD